MTPPLRIDWTDLQVFLQVCEAGSMSKAATRCHLTLAAVSARIRQLEEANGLVLLKRHARGVAPTAAGQMLAAHARRVFDERQRLAQDLLHLPPSDERAIVVLANSAAFARPLADMLGAGSEDAPPPPMLVRESESEATVQALRAGAADVGIVSDAVETRGLATRDLGPDPLVLVVAHTHALASCKAVCFEQTLAFAWVRWSEQGALSTHLQMRALALGRPIDARMTYPRADGVLQLVAQGLGVTVLPRAVVGQHPEAQVACIELDEAWARRRLLAVRVGGGPAAAARLIEQLARAWETPSGSPARTQ